MIYSEIKNKNLELMLALEKEGVIKHTGNYRWSSMFEIIDEPYYFFCNPDHDSILPKFREKVLIGSKSYGAGIHPEDFLLKIKNKKLKMFVLFNLDIFITLPIFFK